MFQVERPVFDEREGEGRRVLQGDRAHHRADGGFRNPWVKRYSKRFGGFLRWVLIERPFKKLPKDPDPSVFSLGQPQVVLPRGSAGELSVTWIGHSTALLQLGTLNIVTDPMWSERASPVAFAGPRRWVRPGLPLEDLPPVDIVVVSHNHYDHLDATTVRELVGLFPTARWLVPLGLAGFLQRLGVREVRELDWWDEVQLDELHAVCTPAQHFSGRGLRDRNASLWCGWALTDGVKRVFFAGDTGYHPEFATISKRHGPFDLTLLPVGAYEPRWFMRPAHMDPEEAVIAFCDLNGKCAEQGAVFRSVMVPIHYGTFKLTDEAMDEPPARARAAWHLAGLPPDHLWLLAHGETRSL